MPPSQNVTKTAYTIPISRDMLQDLPAEDFWTRTINPPSPRERAEFEVDAARDELDAAEARLESALAALAVVEAQPDCDVRPPSYTMTSALSEATGFLAPLPLPDEGDRITVQRGDGEPVECRVTSREGLKLHVEPA